MVIIIKKMSFCFSGHFVMVLKLKYLSATHLSSIGLYDIFDSRKLNDC